MKTLFKSFPTRIILFLSILLLTASTTPGYDENGKDINECMEIGACPDGYTCINTPGSFYCEGEGIETEMTTDKIINEDFYKVKAKCTGLRISKVACTQCPRTYSTTVVGKACAISGFCVCGSISFVNID